jgi:PAS domain S-box-containing protein
MPDPRPASGLHDLFSLPDRPVELPDELPAGPALRVFEMALGVSPLPAMMTDAALDPPGPRVTYVNPPFERLSGYPAAEIVGQTPRVLQGPRTDPAVLAALKVALAAGRTFHGQTVNYGKGGREYPVCWTIVPVRHRGVAVAYLSHQRRIGEDGEADQPFELVFQAANVAISVIAEDGRFVRVNPAYCRLCGHPAEELVGRHFELVVPPDRRAAAIAGHAAYIAGGPPDDGPRELLTKDGRRRQVIRAAGRLAANAGRRFVVSAMTDVTAQRLAEERFELTVAGCGLEFFDYDVPAGRVYYSPGWKRILGYGPDELTDGYEEWEGRLHPDDRAAAVAAVEAFVVGRRADYQVEFRLRHRDGSYRWVQARAAAVRDADGRAVRMVGWHTDLTAQKEYEAEFRQAQKMEAVGQLAGGIAHDFNNLLTVVIGNLELLNVGPDDPNRPLVDAVRTAAGRAAALTTQLLGFSRRLPVRFGPVDVAAVLAEVAALLGRTIDPRVRIETRFAPDLPAAHGDAGPLEQAVLNLCLNARDAMPDGGTLTLAADAVTVSKREAARTPDARPGRFVRVTVADTGGGMTDAVKARIFEPFFTTKPVGKGTGLGLPMVYGTVRQHGGWVRVGSETGRGSTFELFLPPAAAAEPAPAAATAGTEADGGVLVVDDDPAVRRVAVLILGRAGLRVTEAESGDEAVERFPGSGAGVVLLDLTMPGLPPAETAARLRAHSPGVRIVIASGTEPSAEVRAVADAYVAKPYTADRLLAAVRGA